MKGRMVHLVPLALLIIGCHTMPPVDPPPPHPEPVYPTVSSPDPEDPTSLPQEGNLPPLIHSLTLSPGSTVATGEALTLTLEAGDPEGEALDVLWEVRRAPSGGEGRIAPTVTGAVFEADQQGSYGVWVRVTDPLGLRASLLVPVRVLDPAAEPPIEPADVPSTCVHDPEEAVVDPVIISWDIYVDGNNGDDGWDGTQPTWDGGVRGPKRTIVAGLAVTPATGTCHVAPGLYHEQVILKEGVSLLGAGREESIIDGMGVRRGDEDRVVAMAQGSRLSGFSVINGGGYGVECFDVSAVVENNTIAHHEYIGIHLLGYGARDTEVVGNIVTDCGGYGGIYGNSVEGSPLIVNNTVVANRSAGIGFWWPGRPYISNNIVASNLGQGVVIGAGAVATLSYNDVWGNSPDYDGCQPGEGSLSLDPLFEDPLAGDYHLQAGSPSIDAGDPEMRDPDYSRSDMGALWRMGEGLSSDPGHVLTQEESFNYWDWHSIDGAMPIWGPEMGPGTTFLAAKHLDIPRDATVRRATLVVSVDDMALVRLNGQDLDGGDVDGLFPHGPTSRDITPYLLPGFNWISLDCRNNPSVGWLAVRIDVELERQGQLTSLTIVTDENWPSVLIPQ